MSEPVPTFEICHCQHCNGNIEFDASQFANGETRTIECPHCKSETLIFVRQKAPFRPVKEPDRVDPIIGEKFLQTKPKAKKTGTIVLDIASVLIFLIGAGLVIVGCSSEALESTRENSSAIRQIVYTVQYAAGFILIGTSVVIVGLIRIIKTNEAIPN
jgi:hypothetical protein